MKPVWRISILILLSVFLFDSSYADSSSDRGGISPPAVFGENYSTADDSSSALREELADISAFVKTGLTFAKNHSKEETLARLNDPEGEFVQGERYLFAYDMNGTTLALPYEKELIGKNRMSLVDSNGVAFIELLSRVADYGGGYLYYVYPNPAENFTPQVKIAYVEPAGEDWFIGSGLYIPGIDAVLDKEALSGLMARVDTAAAFSSEQGKEKALAAFNDRNGTWSKDTAYIFAYGMNGTTLAMPYQPESIGENRWNYTDTFGSPIARLEIDRGKAGGGFVYVVYYNPGTGRNELKICYILPAGDDWVVGSGDYINPLVPVNLVSS
ncbi:MAG: cache domain-containing protein [Methanospirillum sp.]|nr:cache domain-containing protein [Methanospirillum sp.]